MAWEWKNGKDWKPYDSKTSALIEAASAKGFPSVEVNLQGAPGNPYVIDFAQSKQYQKSNNHKWRYIRRSQAGGQSQAKKHPAPQPSAQPAPPPYDPTQPRIVGELNFVVVNGQNGRLAQTQQGYLQIYNFQTPDGFVEVVELEHASGKLYKVNEIMPPSMQAQTNWSASSSYQNQDPQNSSYQNNYASQVPPAMAGYMSPPTQDSPAPNKSGFGAYSSPIPINSPQNVYQNSGDVPPSPPSRN